MDHAQEIAALVRDVLGGNVLGTYLHGSAVLQGLRPASDVDVLVVLGRSLHDGERRRLLEGLLSLSGAVNGARPVELVAVVQSEVRPWRYPPNCDFLYGEWLREDFEAGAVPARASMPDLAVLVTTVLAAGRSLDGAPPGAVLDPVPPDDVARAALAGVPDLVASLDGDTRNVLLTLARIWVTLATGRIVAKDAAADWVLDSLPPEQRPVLQHARDLYLFRRYSEERWDADLRAQVRPHVEYVLPEIKRLRPVP
jgi:predicted nucleotidyltransferase